MTWITALTAIDLAVATYLAALILALHGRTRSALHERFESHGALEAGERIIENYRPLLLVLALLLTIARVGFFALVLVEVVGLGEAARLTAGTLLASAAISVVVLWLCTAVLAQAIAEHAGTGLVVRSALFLRVLLAMGRPIARALFFIDEAVRRLSGANLRALKAEEHILRSIEESHLEGGLDQESAEMLENVVEFRTTDVAEIMTPRTDIEGIELTNDLTEIKEFIARGGHSRIPVYQSNLDTILGILYIKDLVKYLGQEVPDFNLEQMLRKPIVVPETKPVRALLADFQQSGVHLAIVIDEYGGTAGLVTIEDVIEEIVGEIHDEHEPVDDEEPALVTIDPVHAEVDGRYHIDDLNEALGLELPEDDDYDTVAGFVLAQLGRVPAAGDSFESHRARFTTLAATETHVQKIGIELFPGVSANGPGDTARHNG